jgi:Holliday junction resolvase RusA-like endonuclease
VISFELHGEPVAWKRAGLRVVTPKNGGKPFAMVYTPALTRDYQRAVALAAKVAMKGRTPLLGPLRLIVTAFLAVPKSWPIKRRDAALAGTVRPTGVPDWDNLGKQAADAVKGILWIDDSQVVDGTVRKYYDERPRLRIEVEPIGVFQDELEPISG